MSVRIRKLAGPDGKIYLEELHALAVESDNPKARIEAIKLLLDRGWGKTTEFVEHSGEIVLPVRVVHEYQPASS